MKEILSFTLRIDKTIHEQLLECAEKDKRSLNSEILYIIENISKNEKKSLYKALFK